MNFAQPDILYGLALLPAMLLVVYWASRRRRSAIRSLGDPALIANLSLSVNWRGRRIRYILWFVALALALFGLARPQWGSEVQSVESRGSQIVVVLDVSTSMLAQDIKPDRLTRAKLEIADLLTRLTGDEVGLVLFSGAAFVQFPPTFDYSTARTFVDNAEPGVISRQGTALGEAIRTALTAFDDSRAGQKVILVMTDGESHEGDPLAAAKEAAEEGVIIYAMGFGSPDGEPIPVVNRRGDVVSYKQDRAGNIVRSKLDEKTLQRVAREAKGKYYRASTDGGAIEDLAHEIEGLEKASIENEFETVGIERFQPFLLAALLALVMAELIPDRAVAWRLRRRTAGGAETVQDAG
ncbi:MAG: VWA domain-containing protein [Chloroflexi bacterium]|nr:VWA domain-containing protein [Chloroflexota bacterium]